MRKLRSTAICALAASPVLGMSLGTSSAIAAACAMGSVSTYTAVGFSCNVGPVTFADIVAAKTMSGSGTVTLTDFAPFTTVVNGATEYGLDLFYAANTGFTGGTADVAWSYNVYGNPNIVDAYAELDANKIGHNAVNALTETLSNGTVLKLTSAGVATATFSPVTGWLHAIKDQNNFSAPGSVAFASIVGNGFSVGGGGQPPPPPIPEASTWAMMAIGFLGLGYAGFRSSREPRLQDI